MRAACAWRTRCSAPARSRCAWPGRSCRAGASSSVVGADISASISQLGLVGELVAVGIEQLDAVVVEGIVRGRDHHAEVGAQRAREHGDRRRRHRPEQEHVHADGGEARHQRRLDHVARQPRVLADHDAMAVLAAGEQLARRPCRPAARSRTSWVRVGASANAIGAEQFTRHGPMSP